jgi:catechol 2,3-dioxygenase-like lactoylglutathione lyase family enzyme
VTLAPSLSEDESISPLRPRGIDHLAINVSNLDAARAFYVDVIGCEFVEALPQFNQELLHAGATPISLVCRPSNDPASSYPEPSASGLDHFCLLMVNNATDLRARLSKVGVAVEDEVLNQADVPPTLSLYIRDPSKNLVELRAPQ